MDETSLNLLQKLEKIKEMSDVVVKDKKGFNYTYSDITMILAKVTAGMKKYGVLLIPSIVPGSSSVSSNAIVKTKFTKDGQPYDQTTTEMLFKADMVYRWVNVDNNEDYIDVPWSVTGAQEDPSQALGSGLTYCQRYFLCNFFQIAQTDSDVDTYRSKQKEAEEAEDKAIAAKIIEKFDTILKKYLSDNSEKSDDVKAFIAKYVKDANYLKIKDPSIAAKLLEDFSNKYLTEEK